MKLSLTRLIALLLCTAALTGMAQQTYTFTTAGAAGQNGPSQTQVNNAYSLTNLNGQVTVSLGIQSWTVPSTGLYRIEVSGAKGGNGSALGGLGARMRGDFNLTAGQVLKILVGQMGSNANHSGGGGGSFVSTNANVPLIVAGGGGGAHYPGNSFGVANSAGTITTNGNYGINVNASSLYGPGGTGGNGGNSGSTYTGDGAGGGGFYTNGGDGSPSVGGRAFVNNGQGGAGAGGAGAGGFGGGGGGDLSMWYGSGGGGGYSGGGGGAYYGCGGGGGSYNNGLNQVNTSGVNNGHGLVTITVISGVSIIQTSSIQCNGQLTAALTASGQGGIPPYNYTWYPGGINVQSISGIGAGTYTVVMTDAGSNSYSATTIVTEPTALTVSVASQVNVSCNGQSNGSVAIIPSGGVTPYTFTWSPTGGNSSFATNLSAGIYTIAMRDANNCLATRTIAITQPAPINVLAFTTNQTVCPGDQTLLLGAGALTYTWSHGVVNGVPFNPNVTTTYSVNATDVNGCQGNAAITITVLPAPAVSVSGSTFICSGNFINLTASGADTYSWSHGPTSTVVGVSPSATTDYTVTGTNSIGCKNFAVHTVSVVSSTPLVQANATSTNLCLGQAVTLTGAGADFFAWSHGVTNGVSFSPSVSNTYVVFGFNSCGTGSNAVTVNVNPLPNVTANASSTAVCTGGTLNLFGGGAVTYLWNNSVVDNVPFTPGATALYSVTGTDANGCTGSAVKIVVVNPLPTVTANASSTVFCTGNTVTLSGSGATSYQWSGGVTNNVPFTPTITATYTLIGTDNNGCQNTAVKTLSVLTPPVLSITSSTSEVCQGAQATLTGSGAITYTWNNGISNGVAFTPAITTTYVLNGTNSCGTTSAAVSITVHPLPSVGATASSSAACQGATFALTGTGASTYSWSNGVTDNVPFVPSATATYTVNGTDANGCSNSHTLAVTVHTLPAVSANASGTLICTGQSLTLSGGGAQTYAWTGGVTNNVAFSPSISATYTVTGTDNNGCSNSATKQIVVNQLPTVYALASTTNVCAGNSAIVYGAGAHTYTWSGGRVNGQVFFPSATGIYSVAGTNTITGCTSTNVAVVAINVNPLPVINVNPASVTVCIGASTSLTATGADTYSWSGNILNGVAFTPTGTTTYYVTGTNILTGCFNMAAKTVTVHPRPFVGGNVNPPIVCPGFTTVLTGTGAHSYSWTGNVTDGLPFIPSASASYTVSGTNTVTGCTSTNVAVVNVGVHTPPTLSVLVINPVVCEGMPSTFNAIGAHTFTWSHGIVNNTSFTATPATIYSVTGTNTNNGCQQTTTATILVNPRPVVTILATDTAVCKGGTVILTAQGADSYTWTPGTVNGAVFTPTATKTYTVSGSYTNTGCRSAGIQSVTVIVNPMPVVGIVMADSSVCYGDSIALYGTGAHMYLWSGGILNGKKFAVKAAGSYTVVGYDTTTQCLSNNLAYRQINVKPLPVLSVTQTRTLICLGESGRLNASGAFSYTWSTGKVGAGLDITPSVTAVYTVTGMGTNLCFGVATIMQEVSECTGFRLQDPARSLEVFPNPNGGEFSLRWGSGDLHLRIVNTNGQLVKEVIDREGEEIRVDMKEAGAGVYFIIGEANGRRISEKVIISR